MKEQTMKTLIRLALTLTVAAVASLTPVAFAQTDPLDGGRGEWQGSDGGRTRFYYGVEKTHLLWGGYTTYVVNHIHADGFEMEMTATYWHDPKYQGLVTFTYIHGEDRGTGQFILGLGKDGEGNRYDMLVGEWKSSKQNAGGKWNLWRRL
jgi:hypothetical protein